MGCFYIKAVIRHVADRSRSAEVQRMLVDTGAEVSWIPRDVLETLGVEQEKKDRRFIMANGQTITRQIGYAIIEVTPKYYTVDEVIFGEPGDLAILGARTLEGLGVRIDPEGQQLVAAGPAPAAGHLPIPTTSITE